MASFGCSIVPSGIIPRSSIRASPRTRALRLIGRVPDEHWLLRLVRLLVEVPGHGRAAPALQAMSRLSPAGARRATKLIAGVVRTLVR